MLLKFSAGATIFSAWRLSVLMKLYLSMSNFRSDRVFIQSKLQLYKLYSTHSLSTSRKSMKKGQHQIGASFARVGAKVVLVFD